MWRSVTGVRVVRIGRAFHVQTAFRTYKVPACGRPASTTPSLPKLVTSRFTASCLRIPVFARNVFWKRVAIARCLRLGYESCLLLSRLSGSWSNTYFVWTLLYYERLYLNVGVLTWRTRWCILARTTVSWWSNDVQMSIIWRFEIEWET